MPTSPLPSLSQPSPTPAPSRVGVISRRIASTFANHSLGLAAAAALAALLLPVAARAQTDEIQVYTAEIVSPGEVGLTLHNNFTPEGATTPAFPGGIVPNHSLNGVPEFAYGAEEWLELGLYLPVYTYTADNHFYTESWKLRTLWVVPNADKRDFFYGMNFEFSFNARRWEEHRHSGEVRPIIGVRHAGWDFIVNPILDTGFNGLGRLDFAPAERVAYNFSPLWAVAAEQYSDFGELNHLLPGDRQQQSMFLVLDYNGDTGVEFGIGHGLNGATDKWVVKLMFNFSLHKPAAH